MEDNDDILNVYTNVWNHMLSMYCHVQCVE